MLSILFCCLLKFSFSFLLKFFQITYTLKTIFKVCTIVGLAQTVASYDCPDIVKRQLLVRLRFHSLSRILSYADNFAEHGVHWVLNKKRGERFWVFIFVF